MHIVICLGLGDSRETLGKLPMFLERAGHTVHVCTNDTSCFEDRVQSILRVIKSLPVPSTEVALIGVSAGGLAVLIAATRVKVRRVFSFVPAPPRGISPLWNVWLLRCLWRYLPDMWQGKRFTPRPEDYAMIALNGLDEAVRIKMLQALQPINGREANQLATPWEQPILGALDNLQKTPVHLWAATKDRWVPPRLVERLADKLKSAGCDVHFADICAPHALLCTTNAPILVARVLALLKEYDD